MMERHESAAGTRVLFGLAIVLIGVAMLVERNATWGIQLNIRWWPLLLIFMGLARMAAPGERRGRTRSRRSGFWLLAIGAWGLISELELFGLDYSTSWPLVVVAFGMNMVWRSLENPPPPIQEP
jgi:hypothetical protein